MKRIVISRTDSMGDVILTLPLAGFLKANFPNDKIIFLGSNYTAPIIKSSVNVDEFYSWSEISKADESQKIEFFKNLNADIIIHAFPKKEIAKCACKAGIKTRIGTSHRPFHWFTCNKLAHFSRKSSPLHEAQLNFKLLRPLGFKNIPTAKEISSYYGMSKIGDIPDWLNKILTNNRYNVVIHPKSKGSAREWGLENFQNLVNILQEEPCNIFVSGVVSEKEQLGDFLSANKDKIYDIIGKLDLEQTIAFFSKIDCIVSCPTGPLHLVSALGKIALGIFPPIRPVHPGRWAPIGLNATVMVANKVCNKCRKSSLCECIRNISAEEVAERLISLLKLKQ